MSAYEFDPKKYQRSSSHQKDWGNRLIDELQLNGDEIILDLGCGEGTLTARLAALVPKGGVVGMDSSIPMIQAAKGLETANLKFLCRDIDELDFHQGFDVIFSNAALHWVRDHERLLQNVHEALKLGGVARFNFAGDGNCSNFFAVVREQMSSPKYSRYFEEFLWPWYMPTVDAYEDVVRSAGFFDFRVWGEIADRSFSATELIGWIEQPTLVPLLEQIASDDKQAFRDDVVALMLQRTKRDDGNYFETFRRINLLARRDRASPVANHYMRSIG
ncbi:MAG: methyltransferase domain-containing protein [Methanomassiliicoccales archaeon]|jgi:trans-aconitate methyltransferase